MTRRRRGRGSAGLRAIVARTAARLCRPRRRRALLPCPHQSLQHKRPVAASRRALSLAQSNHVRSVAIRAPWARHPLPRLASRPFAPAHFRACWCTLCATNRRLCVPYAAFTHNRRSQRVAYACFCVILGQEGNDGTISHTICRKIQCVPHVCQGHDSRWPPVCLSHEWQDHGKYPTRPQTASAIQRQSSL